MQKKLVMPGDFLTTEEEYSSGINTFLNDDGSVCSDSVGVLGFDDKKREVLVQKKSRIVKVAGVGSIVFGRVLLVKDNMLVLELLSAEHNGEERRLLHSSGSVMVSRISSFFVKRLNDEFKIGDFVKARIVESNTYGVELSTNEPDLGVIRAYCSNCRQELGLFAGKLKCTNCGSIEGRKLSSDYSLKMG